ncbi:hypothetical protein SAMN05216226_101266 [Halovenus aranensis]|uniref:Uncharacterized protein n=1 Tax=Halovenus aranensis TaxID=890420 RepID=A0A1G8S4V4_9EURY|nr:hypothetical protein [Halovenus aranensis]SDJ23805.1 hypothetical protein SAMN05216226_101266 [Halovenus aranensis]
MRQTPHSATGSKRHHEYRENWTVEGFLGTILVFPVLVAVMTAPALVMGAVAGVVGVRVGERLYGHVARLVTQRQTRAQSSCRQNPQVAPGK